MIAIENARMVLPDRTIENGTALMRDGKFVELFEGRLAQRYPNARGWEVVDGGGDILAPGFVDIHVHGGGGADAMDATPEAILRMAAAHRAHGTTSILPTTMAAQPAQLAQVAAAVREARRRDPCIAGIHMEGPYLSPAQRGAQALDCLSTPDPREYRALLDAADDLRIMGAAPELPGALALGDELARRGIEASIAHSDATYEQVARAVEHGYADVTHLYSGCSMLRRVRGYRILGVVESAFLLDGLRVQVIADGKHLPLELLRMIYRIKGPRHIALITDALRPAGTHLDEGDALALPNGLRCAYEDGVLKLEGGEAFAGSVATMDRLVRTMRDAAVPVDDALRMASQTPADIARLPHKGRIAVGCDADAVLLDRDLYPRAVYVAGKKEEIA